MIPKTNPNSILNVSTISSVVCALCGITAGGVLTARYATRFGTMRYDAVRYDAIRHNMRFHTVRCDTIRYDSTRYDATRYDATRYHPTCADVRMPMPKMSVANVALQ